MSDREGIPFFRRTWSIRSKLVVLNSVLLGVFCLFVFIYFPAQFEKGEIDGLSRKVHSVTEMASFGISPALNFGDRDAAFEIMIGAAQIENLAYVLLLDDSGRTFADYRPGTCYSHIAPTLTPGEIIAADGRILQASAAVTHNAREIGRLYVGVILDGIRAQIAHMRVVIALIIVTLFLVGALLVVGISTLVTRPLTQMANTVHQIAGGNLTTRAVVLSGDEVGRLAHSFNQMVDRVQATYEQLKESERRFRSLIENASDMIAVVDGGGKVFYQSPSAERILGYRVEEFLEHDPLAIIHPEDRHIVQEALRKTRYQQSPIGPVEYRVRHADGSWQTLETQGTNMLDDPAVGGIVINSRNITERKRVEEALRQRTQFEQLILSISTNFINLRSDQIDDGIFHAFETISQFVGVEGCHLFLLQTDGHTLQRTHHWIDESFLPVFDVSATADLESLPWHAERLRRFEPVHVARMADMPPEAARERSLLMRMPLKSFIDVPLASGQMLMGFLSLTSVSHEQHWTEETVMLLRIVAEIFSSVLERKRAEERLTSSLREKELLLREIHHRVKNNLQIISSLLNLQARRTEDTAVLEVLTESRNRLSSMALIHEKLYQSSNIAEINFEEYVKMLAGMLMRSYGTPTRTVRTIIHAKGVRLGVDTAIPCGLMLNELISNCLKYAFQDGRDGEIRINLHPISETRFALVVADDGVGFPKHIDFQNTRSLGMRLVCSLADQLHGNVKLLRNGGTEFQVEFSEIHYAERG